MAVPVSGRLTLFFSTLSTFLLEGVLESEKIIKGGLFGAPNYPGEIDIILIYEFSSALTIQPIRAPINPSPVLLNSK